MNVTLPEKEKVSRKRIGIYVAALIICILAVIVVVGVQVLGNDLVDSWFGIYKLVNRTEQEEIELKANFENRFNNNISGTANCDIQKENKEQEIIFTDYTKEERTENYEVSVNLPYINLKNAKAQKFNNQINEVFKAETEKILINTKKDNEIYTVKYTANIENNILSLIIYSNLKEGSNAQRVMIKTFNYNLEDNTELTMQDVLKIYEIDKNEVQNKIDKDIKEEDRKASELQKVGYNVFSRDLKSDIYKVDNISDFYICDGNIYIIFAYGNEEVTSQMDIVII